MASLTPRQLETLANLKKSGLSTPQEVIAWCESKIPLSSRGSEIGSGGKRKLLRRHSRKYYQEIIAFMKGE